MPRAPQACPPFLLIATEQMQAPLRIQSERSFFMRKIVLVSLLLVSVFGLSAFAEEWNKTYQVGDKPNLRVDTNDASVEVTRGVSSTVSARIIDAGYRM